MRLCDGADLGVGEEAQRVLNDFQDAFEVDARIDALLDGVKDGHQTIGVLLGGYIARRVVLGVVRRQAQRRARFVARHDALLDMIAEDLRRGCVLPRRRRVVCLVRLRLRLNASLLRLPIVAEFLGDGRINDHDERGIDLQRRAIRLHVLG